tara:strand:+ start:1151 stop:2029 length:879 start_codon:yes stop_codon:yes gene_type:complete
MDIYQLRTFATVAREGSITRASKQLYLSQPAVSAHIKAIEESLGLTLFERTPRGMSPTPDGTRLLAKVEATLQAHRELLDDADRMRGRLAGKLRLGTVGNTSAAILGEFLNLMTARNSEVEIELHNGGSADVHRDILRGTVDAGFYVEAGAPDANLTTITVEQFGVYLAAPPGMVTKETSSDWSKLSELPWICPTSSTCCGAVAEALFDTHQFRPRNIVSVDQEQITRTLIAGGVGLGLLHASTALKAEECGEAELICEVRDAVCLLFAHLGDRSQDPILRAADTIIKELAA